MRIVVKRALAVLTAGLMMQAPVISQEKPMSKSRPAVAGKAAEAPFHLPYRKHYPAYGWLACHLTPAIAARSSHQAC